MATKPKAILSTHDGREASPVTKASNVLFENGQTAQDILNDRQDAMISPAIENSSSMFKVGQGDDVDYSANVVNGAYESMVLKGKSMVNCIQEPSSKDVVLPYAFEEGQYVTINDTKESGALGVELKGQTLVNSILSINKTLPCTWTSNNITSRTCALRGAFKTGVYALIVEFGEVLLGGVESSQGVSCAIQVNYADGTANSYSRYNLENYSNKRFFTTFTVNKEVITIELKGTAAQYENNTTEGYTPPTVTINKIMILEYQEGMENWDIPYFEGMASCKMPILHTVSKNLFSREKVEFNKFYIIEGNLDVNNEGTFSEANGLRSLTLSLPQNENFTFSIGHPTGNLRIFASNEKPSIRVKGKKIFGTQGANVATFNTGDYKYFTIVYYSYNSDNTSGKTEEETIATIQIEQGTATTPYEPHKSSILSLPEEVVLRSLPNGVCDTFNTRTGVYTQKTMEVVFNGEEDWSPINITHESLVNDYVAFGTAPTHRGTATQINGKNIIDTHGFSKLVIDYANNGSYVGEAIIYHNNGKLYIRVLKTRLSTQDVNGWKQWLSQNPVTVQYELKTPIVTKINLPSALKSWNTTTHIYSEIPENTLYPILSHSNPSYPVILKPSTKYSIVANSYSNNHTNSAINFNLGGATASTTVGNRVTTITTPSTLSNELLTMSGRGNKLNNVMVIEGDVVGDEPYFEGICDCKSPILSNVGKNLCDLTHLLTLSKEPVTLTGGNMGSTTYSEIEQNSIICTTQHANWWQYNIYKMKVKPSTTYHVSWTKEVVTQPTNGANRRHRIYIMNSEGKTTSVTDGYKTTTLGDGIMYFVIADESDNGGGVGTQSKFTNVQIVEGEAKTTYEPYKSNILSCNGDKIGLTEAMFEQGSIYFSSGSTFASMTQNVDGARIRTKNLLSLNPNISYSVSISNDYYFTLSKYNGEQRGHSETGWTQNVIITPTSDMKDFGVVIRKADNRAIATSEFNQSKFQIREVDKTIVLRSLPNGVCDTLNVETGEYVQRIGEVVLNGNNNEPWDGFTGRGGLNYFRIPCPTMAENNREKETPKFLIADKINFGKYSYLYESTSIPEDVVGGTTKSSALGVQCIYVYSSHF